MSRAIRVVPLGGLGEIGMNCLAIEQSDGILVVDCGTSFPQDDLGVDVVHPNLSYLFENAERVSGVVLTHGHEDHIGALSFLLERVDAPVWGPAHALALVRRRFEDRGFAAARARLTEVTPRRRFGVGPFEVEPIRVAHSITEATALAIRTRAGLVVHSGDFNFDPDPPDGEPTDEERLSELGRAGVELLLSDSTNVDVEERAGSEREVGLALGRVIAAASGRVFVALFASNVQRLRSLGDIAHATGRKICLLGRSLNTQVDIAQRLGKLSWPSNLLISAEQAATLAPECVLALTGGSQAEPTSALRRLASGDHHQLQITAGDTVVMSARIIPGNERTVLDMSCDLLRQGAHLVTRVTDPDVHTSGHAGRSEQRRLIELLRPRAFLPIHGTLHHLLRHQELAREMGVAHTSVTENGGVVAFDPELGLMADGRVPHGRVYVSATGEALPPGVLKRRAELARSGSVVISVVLSETGEPRAAARVSSRGVAGLDDAPRALERVAQAVSDALAGKRRGLAADELVRRAARRVIVAEGGARPVIEVHLLRVE
ncbi:MAG: ribonuclease J [Polyangiaceae bacterium]|nr:ribonuclease J [Polyangiaceae bacterium]